MMNKKNQLKNHRNQSGYKQEEVANYLGMCLRQYQRLEANTPKAVRQFYEIAKLFNTSIESLVYEADTDNIETKVQK